MRKYNITKHLKESDLDKPFINCPFCGSGKTKKKAGLIQQQPEVLALECPDCHTGYANRQPTIEYLKSYYSNYYEKLGRNTIIKQNRLVKHIYKRIGLHESLDTYNVLDFGGGDGSVSYGIGKLLLESGSAKQVNVYVVDPNFAFTHPGISGLNILGMPAIDEIPAGKSFNLAIASAIIEHVKDPRKILHQLLDRMCEKGLFYARTPYIFPFMKLFGKFGYRLDMKYPGHIFDFGSRFWNNVIDTLEISPTHQIIRSQTSLVASVFSEKPIKTLLSYLFKVPGKILKSKFHLVGGWEVFIQKI